MRSVTRTLFLFCFVALGALPLFTCGGNPPVQTPDTGLAAGPDASLVCPSGVVKCGKVCCASGEVCNADTQCEVPCVPNCGSRTCGKDPICNTQSCGPECSTGSKCSGGNCLVCANSQCGTKQCGKDSAGCVCGTCGAGSYCDSSSGMCVTCVQACAGKHCGTVGSCSCGDCPGNQTCDSNGQCVSQGCLDGRQPCGGTCCGSSDTCDQSKDRCTYCPKMCGTTCCTADQKCNAGNNQCVSCVANCGTKQCGTDSCGNTCGSCASGCNCDNSTWTCTGPGTCNCDQVCTGRVCGSLNGCDCGRCGTGTSCNASGQCESQVGPDAGDCSTTCYGHCGMVQDCYCGSCPSDAGRRDSMVLSDGGHCADVCIGRCSFVSGCDCGSDCGAGYYCDYASDYCIPGGKGDGSVVTTDASTRPDDGGYCSEVCSGRCDYVDICDCGKCGYGYYCDSYQYCEWSPADGGLPDASPWPDASNCSSVCYGRCGSLRGCYCGNCSSGYVCDSLQYCDLAGYDASTPWFDASYPPGKDASYPPGKDASIGPGLDASTGACDPVYQDCSSYGYFCYWSGTVYDCETPAGKIATGSGCAKEADCVPGDTCLGDGTTNYCYLYCAVGSTCSNGKACSTLDDLYGYCPF